MHEDLQLVRRCQEGEIEAFRHLFEKYQARIFNTVYALLGNREDADDCTQEVFLRAYRSLSAFRGQSEFYTWLYRIAVNLCLDEIKRQQRHPSTSLDQLIADDALNWAELLQHGVKDPAEQAESAELEEMIRQLLNALPPEQRAALVLKEIDGFSYEEICDILRCSMGTVKSRLFRARAQLKELLWPLYREWSDLDDV